MIGEPMKAARMSRLDRLGMLVSSACLIHCLALPVLTAMLPFFSLTLPGDDWTHRILLAMALPITGMALLRGWKRHRARRPALFGLSGLTMVALGLFAPHGAPETVLTVSGGMLIVWAHLLNWRARHG